MPQVATAFLQVLLFIQVPQDCSRSGGIGWSNQLREVLPDCAVRIVSPDGTLYLRVDTEGQIGVSRGDDTLHVAGRASRVEPPAMVSWSPISDAFFVNDGEGSGMTSVFRMFRIRNAEVSEDATIHKRAVALFRRLQRCRPEALDPDVWGLGWSADGKHLHVLVQSTVHNPCGAGGHFIGVTINAENDAIEERLSESATRRRFGSLLPPNLRQP